jgi:hypothetical protein
MARDPAGFNVPITDRSTFWAIVEWDKLVRPGFRSHRLTRTRPAARLRPNGLTVLIGIRLIR